MGPLDPWGCGGSWTNTLPVGVYNFPISQSLGGAPQSAAVNYHVTVTPVPLVFTAPNPAGNDYTTGFTTISGTSADLATPVTVSRSVTGSPDPIPGCIGLTVQPDNTWSCAATFEPETWDLYATQGALNASMTDYRVYIPAPTLDQADPMHVAVSGSATATFSGTTTFVGTPSSYVQVYFPATDPYFGPGSVCASSITPVPGGGTWECTIDVWDEPFDPDSTYTFTVRQEDLNAVPFRTAEHQFVYGNDYPAELLIDPFDADGIPWQNTPFIFISGEAPSGELVDVYLDGATLPLAECSGVTVDFQGQWSCGPVQVGLGGHTSQRRPGDGHLNGRDIHRVPGGADPQHPEPDRDHRQPG